MEGDEEFRRLRMERHEGTRRWQSERDENPRRLRTDITEDLPPEIKQLQRKVKIYKTIENISFIFSLLTIWIFELCADSLIFLLSLAITPIALGCIFNKLRQRAETRLNDSYPVDERLLNFMNRDPSELRQITDYVDLGEQWPYYEEASELRVGIPERGQIIEYVDLGQKWLYYEEPYELGENIDQCMVCQLAIYEKEVVLKCPHCSVSAHKVHFLEWVKIKGYCPQCGAHLNNKDFMKEKNMVIYAYSE